MSDRSSSAVLEESPYQVGKQPDDKSTYYINSTVHKGQGKTAHSLRVKNTKTSAWLTKLKIFMSWATAEKAH